jgi:predicted PurR-regulated permease PerM
MARPDGSPPGLNLLVPLATIILLVATLHYARNVLVPLCLAILLTFILSPVASQLEKAGLRRVAAVSVLFIAAAVTLAWVVGHQVIDVAAQVPEYRENIDRKLESVRSIGDGKLKGFVDSIDGLQQEIFANSPSPVQPRRMAKSPSQRSRKLRGVPS